MVDKKVYMDPDSKGGLSVFARAGIAESSVNRFGRYLSLGAVYTGPFRGREDDQVGLGLAIAINTDDYRTSLDLQGTPSTSSEKNVEFSYLARLSLRASVQFDVQYIIDPDTNPVLDNALVGIMRWTISL